MSRPHRDRPPVPSPRSTSLKYARPDLDDEKSEERVDGGMTRLTLGPPLPTSSSSDRKRESTLDSADQAEGIFDLYERDRDSWVPHMDGGQGETGEGEQEVIRDDLEGSRQASTSTSTQPFPRGVNNQQQPYDDQEAVVTRQSTPQPSGQDHSLGTPEILITPDKHLHLHSSPGTPISVQRNGNVSNRNSTLSVSSSTASVPPGTRSGTHSPAGHPISRRALGSGMGAAGKSEVSVAGSSQYPGEENDAFFVRSTYARLDAEGVHGDGWDPGVERTRGGPSQGKRATKIQPIRGSEVGAAERDFLASLDRYGFVNEPLRNRSETRLALIPAGPLLKIPKLPKISPIPGGRQSQPSPPPSTAPEGPGPRAPDTPRRTLGEDDAQRKKEERRVGKWIKMMSVKKRDQGGNTVEWGWRSGAEQKVHRRVYKGIPDRWRMAAWWTLSEDRVGEHRTRKGKDRACRPAEAIKEEYRHAIDLPSTHDVQIDLDVPRTISGHTLFVTRYGSGQRNLFHVLHSFSLLCDTCGYCQGMGPIAATLLCYFDPERVYTLLVRLHDIYGMHSIFAPGFPGLLEAFYVQERLMEYLMPEVYTSFQRNMISSSAWGTKWYITLFVNTLPFSQQLRLWDVLWLDGRDVIIMISIAILWSFRDLLSAKNATFESILSLLSSYFVAEDEDALMDFIRKMLGQQEIRTKMDGWREEWASLVSEGKEGSALL